MLNRPPPFFGARTVGELQRQVEIYNPWNDDNIPRKSDGKRHGVDKLISSMLENDYNRRISLKEILQRLERIVTKAQPGRRNHGPQVILRGPATRSPLNRS
jgi:hypothetical protein